MARTRRHALVLTLAAAFGVANAASSTAGALAADPAVNHPPGRLPAACSQAPSSASCVAAALRLLDDARASLGQGPYKVPRNFATLSAPEQAFVLANLDRIQAGLPPVTGLTSTLDADAAAGVKAGSDPRSSDPSLRSYTANWAGGVANMLLAYEMWMYDDGPGSPNLDCRSAGSSGCWGHRHDVLWDFGAGQSTLAMGAASGSGPSSPGYSPGYALIIAAGASSYHPAYIYTWAQALADGARGGRTSGTSSGPTIAASDAQALGASAAVRVTLQCAAHARASCIGRVIVRAPAAAAASRARVLASSGYALAAGETAHLTLPLAGSGRALLARTGRLRASVIVTAKASGNQIRTVAVLRVTLRKPRPASAS